MAVEHYSTEVLRVWATLHHIVHFLCSSTVWNSFVNAHRALDAWHDRTIQDQIMARVLAFLIEMFVSQSDFNIFGLGEYWLFEVFGCGHRALCWRNLRETDIVFRLDSPVAWNSLSPEIERLGMPQRHSLKPWSEQSGNVCGKFTCQQVGATSAGHTLLGYFRRFGRETWWRTRDTANSEIEELALECLRNKSKKCDFKKILFRSACCQFNPLLWRLLPFIALPGP